MTEPRKPRPSAQRLKMAMAFYAGAHSECKPGSEEQNGSWNVLGLLATAVIKPSLMTDAGWDLATRSVEQAERQCNHAEMVFENAIRQYGEGK